jgi:hemolysin activation/secretion protein
MRSRMLTTVATRRWLAAGAVVAALTLAGCSGGSAGGTVAKTMNQQQATAQAEQIVRDTASALHPQPSLDFNTSLPNETGPCLAENLPSADKMVQASRTAQLGGVRDSQEIIAIANQVQAYWKKQGYVVTSTANFSKGQPAIFGHTPEHDPFAVPSPSASKQTPRAR